MSELNLGKIIEPNEVVDRDAIHVAVAPVVAGETLTPGTHIGLAANGKAYAFNVERIGVVDPFLHWTVREGQRFWICLYPKTVTSLRHHWTHPAFSEELSPEPKEIRPATASERWLMDFAASVDVGYRDLMTSAELWIEREEYMCRGGLLEGRCVPEEFWTHYENVTGKRGEGSFFTCSC